MFYFLSIDQLICYGKNCIIWVYYSWQ